jgi:hypothetical protein
MRFGFNRAIAETERTIIGGLVRSGVKEPPDAMPSGSVVSCYVGTRTK